MRREPTAEEARTYFWLVGDLRYKLWRQQVPIYNGIRSLPPDTLLAVILCARQFGKSVLGVLLAVEECLRLDNKCVLIAGPTLKQTREIVVPRIELITRDAPRGLITRSRSLDKWYIGSCELVIGGFDTNGSSQRGKTLEKVYIEEVVDSDSDQYLESLRSDIGPAMAHAKEPKIVVLTTPPKIPDHAFVTETMVEAKLNNSLYRYTIDDNIELTPVAKERCFGLTGGRMSTESRREWFCEIVRDESIVVVPAYDDTVHVRDLDFNRNEEYQITIDWGGVRDKTVGLLHRHDAASQQIEFYREIVFPPNTPTAVIGKEIKALRGLVSKVDHIHADAPGQVLVDLYNDHGIHAAHIPKGYFNNMVANANNQFFHKQILIDTSCKFLRETCRSGMLNRQKTDFLRSENLGHCDALAALMYALITQVKKPYVWKPPTRHIPEPMLAAAEAHMNRQTGGARIEVSASAHITPRFGRRK